MAAWVAVNTFDVIGDSTATGRIEGTVLYKNNNEPVQAAWVFLSNNSTVYSVISSTEGKFLLEEILPGSYRINVSKEGSFPDRLYSTIKILPGHQLIIQFTCTIQQRNHY